LGIDLRALQGLADAIRIPNWLGDVEYEVIPAKPGRPAVSMLGTSRPKVSWLTFVGWIGLS
jgi:hypothetical protein